MPIVKWTLFNELPPRQAGLIEETTDEYVVVVEAASRFPADADTEHLQATLRHGLLEIHARKNVSR
jgi:hypothetical protein